MRAERVAGKWGDYQRKTWLSSGHNQLMARGGIWLVHDFTSGKMTVRGAPNPHLRTWETVTVVRRDQIDHVLGTWTEEERIRVLRAMRDRGWLIVPKQARLQH